MRSLGGGGVERSMLNLASALLERGHRVDLVVCRADGAMAAETPVGAKVVALAPASALSWRSCLLRADPKGLRDLLRPVLLPLRPGLELRHLPALAGYLRRERPQALLAAMPYANLVALWARRAAGAPTRIAVSERNTLSAFIHGPQRRGKWRWRHVLPLIRRLYPQADAIIAVSEGVAEDLARTAGLPREAIATVYNPVVSERLHAQAREAVDHPWFAPGAPPVILAAGRLLPQKDFPTLLRAFARLRRQQEARLVILGEGKERAALERLARELGVADAVNLPGFAPNPFAYMARAALFVLSSAHEGLPGVLIQALACGCPAVSTDCPSGPAEILEGGRWGPLVPVGDDAALAEAMLATLAAPLPRERLRERGALFSVERAAERYRTLLFGGDADAPTPPEYADDILRKSAGSG